MTDLAWFGLVFVRLPLGFALLEWLMDRAERIER